MDPYPKNVLIAGVGPIPPRQTDKLHAPGLRLWAFASELAKLGHRVVLCEAMFGGEDVDPTDLTAEVNLLEIGNIDLRIIDLDVRKARRQLAKIAAETRPECAVASTDVMCAALASAKLACPTWLDFNGHPMTERQMIGQVFGDDSGLADQWSMLVPSLLGGDRYSVCCTDQKAALIGELGVCGRLNRHTVGVDLVHVIYPGTSSRQLMSFPGRIRGKRVGGNFVGEDDVVVLHTGGYNTWMDEASLFAGLELAMRADPRIRFVSTGGAIKGHNEKTFEDFCRRVEASKFQNRFHFAGWVPTDLVWEYLTESDMAVNIDLPCHEGTMGWRNRIVDWALAELPILTTPLSEISRDLGQHGCAEVFAFQDPEALSQAILHIANDLEGARKVGEKARQFVIEKYDYEKLIEPLAAWVANPTVAPDLPTPFDRPNVRGLLRPQNELAAAVSRPAPTLGRPSPFDGATQKIKRTLKKILIGRHGEP